MVAFTIAEIIPVPVADERADNTDDQIADESEAGPSYDFSGQPASHKANHQYHQQTLILKYARCLLRGQRRSLCLQLNSTLLDAPAAV